MIQYILCIYVVSIVCTGESNGDGALNAAGLQCFRRSSWTCC